MGSKRFLHGDGANWRAVRRGFTLVELLIVVAVIALLVAIIIPSLGQSREIAQNTICQSNLHRLHSMLMSDANRVSGGGVMNRLLPPPAAWLADISSRDGGSIAVCPKDQFEDTAGVLENYYVIEPIGGSADDGKGVLLEDVRTRKDLFQNHKGDLHRIVTIDGQKRYEGSWEGQKGWPEDSHGKINYPNFEVGYEDDAGLVVEPEAGKAIALWGPEGTHGSHGSKHWLCYDENGNGASDCENEIVLKLTGTDSQNRTDYPAEAALGEGGAASYGMNNAVDQQYDADQILMLEYNKLVASYRGTVNDVFDDEFAPRHFGKANVLLVGGNVVQMTATEADPAIHPEHWYANEDIED
ncbi:MAG: type II secretion system protein [Phycisphaerae bacterium]